MSDHPQPFSDPELDRFAAQLREAFSAAPDPAVRTAHLAAMASVVPDEITSAEPSRRGFRRVGVRGAVAAAGLVLIGGSALAATGTLPDPVQNVVADAVDNVVDLPGGHANASGGNPTNPNAAQNKVEAKAFVTAKKDWLACMKASPTPTGTVEDEPAATDNGECGEKPNPRDFRADKTPRPDRTPKPEKSPDVERTPKPERTDRAERTAKPSHTPKGPPTSEPTPTLSAEIP